MNTGHWPVGYYAMTCLDTGKWRAPKLWLDVIDRGETRANAEALDLGIEGDWSADRDCYRAAMRAAVARLLQLMPGEFDLAAESGKAVKEMFQNVLIAEHRRRNGQFPGFIEWPSDKKDEAA